MTSDEKKAAMLAKLSQPATPIVTQVVRVEPTKPTKLAKEETDHFNAYPSLALAADVRIYKARNRISIQDIINEALTEYLQKRGALTE